MVAVTCDTMFEHVNEGTMVVFVHHVRVMVVCWHRDLWFGGACCCSMVVVVHGELARKRKVLAETTLFLIKKNFFLRVISLKQRVHVEPHVTCLRVRLIVT